MKWILGFFLINSLWAQDIVININFENKTDSIRLKYEFQWIDTILYAKDFQSKTFVFSPKNTNPFFQMGRFELYALPGDTIELSYINNRLEINDGSRRSMNRILLRMQAEVYQLASTPKDSILVWATYVENLKNRFNSDLKSDYEQLTKEEFQTVEKYWYYNEFYMLNLHQLMYRTQPDTLDKHRFFNDLSEIQLAHSNIYGYYLFYFLKKYPNPELFYTDLIVNQTKCNNNINLIAYYLVSLFDNQSSIMSVLDSIDAHFHHNDRPNPDWFEYAKMTVQKRFEGTLSNDIFPLCALVDTNNSSYDFTKYQYKVIKFWETYSLCSMVPFDRFNEWATKFKHNEILFVNVVLNPLDSKSILTWKETLSSIALKGLAMRPTKDDLLINFSELQIEYVILEGEKIRYASKKGDDIEREIQKIYDKVRP